MIEFRFKYISTSGESKNFWITAESKFDAVLVAHEVCGDIKSIKSIMLVV